MGRDACTSPVKSTLEGAWGMYLGWSCLCHKTTCNAPRHAVERLPFHVWMALAQSGPHSRPEDDEQSML